MKMDKGNMKFKITNIALWIVQGYLAVLFLWQGVIKLTLPANLPDILRWVYDLHRSSPGLLAFIGISELLGAAGLILPGLTKIQPRLTPLAALGLAVIMVLAVVYNIQRGEMAIIGLNVVVFLLAAFVAYGRWRLRPPPSRNP